MGSHCEETYHVSDAEGRKYAACERGGGENTENSYHKVKLFRKKKKADNFKTYCTQFMAPVVTLSYLEEGGGVVTLKSLHI